MRYTHLIIGVPDEQDPEQVALEILADYSENNYESNPEGLEQVYARIVSINDTDDVMFISQDGSYGDARDLCLIETSKWSSKDEQAFTEISANDHDTARFALRVNADPSLTPSKFAEEEL
jgi:hypothetical protein